MIKKIGYAFLVGFILYFCYTIFFKKIETPVELMKKEMVLKNVVYRLREDATVYADEQIGNIDNDFIRFNGVTVELKEQNILIKSDSANVDINDMNIIFENNVEARTIDGEWEMFTQHAEYKEQGSSISTTERTIVKNLKDNRTLEADVINTTTSFSEISAIGNVNFTTEDQSIKTDSVIYNVNNQYIYANGNVQYSDLHNEIRANNVNYNLLNKTVDATGSVKYNNATMQFEANHFFYDDINKKVSAEGNGTFNYKKRNVHGTFQSAQYDINTEFLNTSNMYTLNYDDYKVEGVGVEYFFKTGDAKFTNKFSIKKQNFSISGNSGNTNTIERNIFSNNVSMYSVQGDLITANKGEGSFEKQEFQFSGNVQGKIRGNVSNLMTSTEKMVDSEAIQFKGGVSKIYFIVSSNNKNMNITRSEIKDNVSIKYKEVSVESSYNEINTFNNIIMARDKVIVYLPNQTQMTSNYLWFNLNEEKGKAQDNVKIVNYIGQSFNVNTSANNASINMKSRTIILEGNVYTYQGETRIESDRAIYDIDKRSMLNQGNINMRYEVNNETVNTANLTNNENNIFAINEVKDKLFKTINNKIVSNQIELPKKISASNGVVVNIRWKSSNNSVIRTNGTVNKQYYGGNTVNVDLEATLEATVDSEKVTLKVVVPPEDIYEMLQRASFNLSSNDIGQINKVSLNVYNGIIDIPVKWDGVTAVLGYNGVEYRKQVGE